MSSNKSAGTKDEAETKTKLLKAFNTIDLDANSTISKDELVHLLETQGHFNLSDTQISSMLEKIDFDKSGDITFDEFHQAFSTTISDAGARDSNNSDILKSITSEWLSFCNVDLGTDLSVQSSLTSSPASFKSSSDKQEHYISHVYSQMLPFVSGAAGGVASRTLTAPLERIKILAQTGNLRFSGRNLLWNELKYISQTEGVRGLFKGNLLNCARVLPFGGTVCVTYGLLVRALPSDDVWDRWEPLWRFIAGAVSGGVAVSLTYPLDTLKTRFSMYGTQGLGSFGRKGIEQGLFKNLYKGLAPTLCAMSFFVGLQQSCYDTFRIMATDRAYLNLNPSVPLFLACGVGAGIAAQTVVYPLDVVRRRMQIESGSVASVAAARTSVMSNYTWLAIRNVVKQNGFKSLFAGLVPTYLKVAPSVATSVTVRDAFLGRLKRRTDN